MAESNGNLNAAQSTPPAAQPPAAGPMTEKNAFTWGMFCHLAALAGFIGIPFGNIIGPLVVWLIKKDEHPFIEQQGRAALNFQISMAIYGIVAALLIFIFIGFLLLIALGIFDLIFVIMASIKASKGESQKYPLSITFIK